MIKFVNFREYLLINLIFSHQSFKMSLRFREKLTMYLESKGLYLLIFGDIIQVSNFFSFASNSNHSLTIFNCLREDVVNNFKNGIRSWIISL